MPLSEKAFALLRELEGFRAEEYLCSRGKRTIGYGHVIGATEEFSSPLSHAAACAILRDDVCFAEAAVEDLVRMPLTQNQYDALAIFVFNIGRRAFAQSTLLRRLNEGGYQSVPDELMKWVNADGQRIPGLVARRKAEVSLWNSVA